MTMDIWQYMLQKELLFKKHSAVPDRPLPRMFLAAPDSPEGKRGVVFGALRLTDNAYLSVFERVVVRGAAMHRLRYSYALIVDEAHEYGWERDPTHNPAVHEHAGKPRTRKGSEPISIAGALERSWEILSWQAEVRRDDPEPPSAATSSAE